MLKILALKILMPEMVKVLAFMMLMFSDKEPVNYLHMH